MHLADPHFWRAGAISIVAVMGIVLIMLTVDSLAAIRAGGSNVPPYSVINQRITYEFNARRGYQVPVIGDEELIFGRRYTEEEAADLLYKGKLVIQSRACMLCHTFFGNGSYYAPDLTKAWLDPLWANYTDVTKEEAIVRFLMDPEDWPMWIRRMPDLDIDREEAEAVTAYLKWLSSVDTNGFPANFGRISIQ